LNCKPAYIRHVVAQQIVFPIKKVFVIADSNHVRYHRCYWFDFLVEHIQHEAVIDGISYISSQSLDHITTPAGLFLTHVSTMIYELNWVLFICCFSNQTFNCTIRTLIGALMVDVRTTPILDALQTNSIPYQPRMQTALHCSTHHEIRSWCFDSNSRYCPLCTHIYQEEVIQCFNASRTRMKKKNLELGVRSVMNAKWM